ncbi:MAG: hypothetical protein CME70_06325 [Halobacteriovorax sp.]|nr:hypothetical protein [Halobacteriovorax sp.]|tara:strand:- start:166 stop:1698 length:1533 start_codon:yes stop_codon:yes gene_type:complete
MFFILDPDKDTYITNKIMNNKFRTSDANVGMAGTLDLFKLHDESVIDGETEPQELSRILLKFDYEGLQELTSSILDLNDDSFECKLHMSDIMGGQAVPVDFTIILFPLAKSFDEGSGKDVLSFNDLDVSNWVTSSISNSSAVEWHTTGANAQGLLGSNDIDIISSGNLNDGSGIQDLFVTQHFVNGTENLVLDITTIVSASMAGLIPNHGFRLSFSGSQETDNKTRFVKRFASRHVSTSRNRPRIEVSWDNSNQDNHKNFYFDLTGSLFLKNYHYGAGANILAGNSLGLSGASCMKVDIVTGSFTKTVDVSQLMIGENSVDGVYTASFAIDTTDSTNVNPEDTIQDFVLASGSITFDEYWRSTDNSICYHTGSLKIQSPFRTAFSSSSRRLDLVTTNIREKYHTSDKTRFRLFARDLEVERKATKLPVSLDSIILNEVYYRIKDVLTGDVIVPFKQENNGTRVSSDVDGMFFDFYMSALPSGRSYTVDYLVLDRDVEYIIEDSGAQFRVE